MAESSKTLEAGATHNINGTTNINLVYQKASFAGTQKRSNDVQVNQWMLWQRTVLRKASWLVRNMGLNGGWDRREVGPPWHYL